METRSAGGPKILDHDIVWSAWKHVEVHKRTVVMLRIAMNTSDENEHLKYTQMLLQILPKDDPDFAEIKEELREEMTELFHSVCEQEKDWARYIFQHGDMLGLDETICCQLVDWLASKRMGAIGLVYGGQAPKDNPIPWMSNWISSASLQVAPQETEISSYIIGVLDGGVSTDELKELRVEL